MADDTDCVTIEHLQEMAPGTLNEIWQKYSKDQTASLNGIKVAAFA